MGQHHATTVKESTFLVNERLATKSRVKKEKNIEDTERGRQEEKLEKVSMESMTYSHDCNLWGPGPPRYVPSMPWAMRQNENPDDWELAYQTLENLRDPTGKNAVNPELLFNLSKGMERSRQYFEVFCENGVRTDTTRTEVEVSLAKIDGDGKRAVTERQDKEDRWVSTDSKLLSKKQVFKTTELTNELKDLNTMLKEHNGNTPAVVAGTNPKGNKTKPFLVAAVIKARKRLISHDSDWASKRLVQIREANGTDPDAPPLLSDEDRKKAELALPFYNFLNTEDPSLEFAKTQHTVSISASSAPQEPEHGSQIDDSSVVGSPSSEVRMSQASGYSAG
jgi:hypothetical protein